MFFDQKGMLNNKGGMIMDQKANADHKKEEREQVIELGSDVTKSSKGNIYT